MGKRKRLLLFLPWLTLLIVGISLMWPRLTIAHAAGTPPRQREETVTETLYTWWLVPWSQPNQPVCQLQINHPDQPTAEDVLRFCGWDLYQGWVNTPACPEAATGGDVSRCQGYYLHYIGAAETTHTVLRRYPDPEVVFHLLGCEPAWPLFRCTPPVTLVFEGREYFPEAHITEISVTVPGQGVTHCQGDTCTVTLPLPRAGSTTVYRLTFFAISSWGDRTALYQAQVQVQAPAEEPIAQVTVGVLSSQWVEESGVDACSQAWEAFPPAGETLPDWAQTPDTPEALATQVTYLHLAGRLIAHGFVDASTCPNRGVNADGTANPCGADLAREVVYAWQNQFDPDLWAVAREVGIPAVLFKRLIAHESQFWPGEYPERIEVGFGQLSPIGMDTLLLWAPEFFQPLCETLLGSWRCTRGYLHLSPVARQILYNSLWVQANLTCANCPFGIDLERTRESLSLFAHLLRANCRQMGQTVRNITRRPAGQVASYTDLWRFTLANYNGPDCIYEALLRTYNHRQPLTWEKVREHFPKGCEGTRAYVEQLAP